MIRIFTIGYQQRSPEELVSLLRRARVDVVLDVRETASSRKPGFAKQRLAATLATSDILYIHAPFAGNPKRFRRNAASHEECLALFGRHLEDNPVILEAFDELVGRCLDHEQRVCLMCYERRPDECHRTVLGQMWQAGCWREVRHLGVPKK